MKFAKELEDDLVPEWRVKYLNYRLGKKKIKAIERALHNVQRGPKWAGGARPGGMTRPSSDAITQYPQYDFTNRRRRGSTSTKWAPTPIDVKSAQQDGSNGGLFRRHSEDVFAKSPTHSTGDSERSLSPDQETAPLNTPQRSRRRASYGSIVASPPMDNQSNMKTAKPMRSLQLPDPALDPDRERRSHEPGGDTSDAFHVGRQAAPRSGSTLPKYLQFKRGERAGSLQEPRHRPVPSKLRRIFSVGGYESPNKMADVRLEYPYKDVDAKQDEFFDFLDQELNKIEDFYQMKEEEATGRLHLLRQQLHQMRDQRMEELHAEQRGEHVQQDDNLLAALVPEIPLPSQPLMNMGNGKNDHDDSNGHKPSFLKPIEDAIKKKPRVGKTSRAMGKLGSPSSPHPQQNEDSKDYVRRNRDHERVHYKVAKRKLKLAMQEFYRALELLKSYALLNRTGFRKINKKYDKVVQARPTLRYMSEKVSKAHFVTSNLIENHIVAVEDLYARYFERGNHKVAVGKLRTKLGHGDQSATTFRNGLYVAAGVAFALDSFSRVAQHLQDPDPARVTQASYLLQIYAGYFLALLLFLVFVIDCWVWTETRINYIFIFEFDTRHVLDWRQLAELPCVFLFLNGLFLWLNFRQVGGDTMYLYWPIVLCGLTLLLMALPLPILYHNARRWWGYSNWRLLLAGLYPVEFRDFFLGDMYCSESYALSQVAIFFCVYAHNWRNPAQCNSNHSHVLGFLTTLPPIWRALQSLRRYHDSRSWFPHLANFVKYLGNIMYYMSLSLYRIHINPQYKAIFITFAAVNGAYTSFWDVAMDFSLGNPYAKHPFLRDHLGYHRVWVYYFAAITDIVLRQQWILYALFVEDLQHSATLSFFVGMAEVLRRGLWALFRVENEHCNNVGKFRASRDIPLPYPIVDSNEAGEAVGSHPLRLGDQEASTTGHDVEQQQGGSPLTPGSSLRQRFTPNSTPGIRALQRVGTTIAAAHAVDYERKRKPGMHGDSPHGLHELHEDSDEEDEDEQEDPENIDGEEQEDVMLAQRLRDRGEG